MRGLTRTSRKGFSWKPAAGSQSPAASSGRGDWNKILWLYACVGVCIYKNAYFLSCCSYFWHLLAYWGRRESHQNTMWKKLQKQTIFLPKSYSWQLVAPSGLLFELLFVTLGRFWGPLEPKLQKDAKLTKNGSRKGTFFGSFVCWRTLKAMLICALFSFAIFDSFWVTLGKPKVAKVT